MKVFVVAILFASAAGGIIGDANDINSDTDAIDNDENCITIRHINFEKEILMTDVSNPYQLVIDYHTNTLFFSITARSSQMFESAYLDLKTGVSEKVSGIHGGFANAVNGRSNTVYLGGEDGVYEYNYDDNTATNLHVKENINVWQMFYKNGLYLTTYPQERAYFYRNNEIKEVEALRNVNVMLLAVTNDMDYLYFNSSGVFLYNRDKQETVLLNTVVANGVTSDTEGNLFFSSPSGIYYYDSEIREVEYLVNLDDVYGIAVESSGSFIYATEDSIFRLKPVRGVCKSKNQMANNHVEIVIGQ